MTGSTGVLGALAAHLLGAGGLVLPHLNYSTILPELILLGGMLVILAASALSPRPLPTEVYATATVGLGIASLIASLVLWRDVTSHGAFTAIARSIDVDGFAVFFLVVVSCILIVAPMFAAGYLRREGITGCEYYVLALISGSGAMFMASANDLILIFLGLEILSIPLYVLAGLDHRREASGEAAMKYFVLGAFSSAIFVYGIALTYGATGSTNLAEIGAFLSRNVITSNGVLLGGLALLLVGFAFKVAAVPFHMWTPDVYQGAPTPATGFMAAMAKAGGFAALLRVFVSTFPTLRTSWQPVVWVLAILTLVLGAVVAIVQNDVKRMLAYSSINHAGFVLLGLEAATARGIAGSLYYVFVYSLLVLGSFAVVAAVGGNGDADHDISRYRGLGRRRPVLAVGFAILLLAQAGAPFTTGFFSKFYVVEAAVAAHSYALAVIAMGSAGVAAFFYLRVVFVMFSDVGIAGASDVSRGGGEIARAGAVAAEVREQDATLLGGAGASAVATLVAPAYVAAPELAPEGTPSEPEVSVSPWVTTGLVLCVGATLVFGIWPQPLVDFAHQATLIF
ncbi:MAG: proton-translocating NADH-quinone oxidoreductase, chain [Acidimicrobiaceae bacterium]|nr:proton-translocating NADH-quinone oxidoreductase, chain [Acidimicrobiaceae bacterium]